MLDIFPGCFQRSGEKSKLPSQTWADQVREPSLYLHFHVTTKMSLKHGQHSVTCLTETISAPWLWIPGPCPLSASGNRDPSVGIFKGLRISLLYENVFWKPEAAACDLTLHTPIVERQALSSDRSRSGTWPVFSLFPAPPGPLSWDLRVLHQWMLDCFYLSANDFCHVMQWLRQDIEEAAATNGGKGKPLKSASVPTRRHQHCLPAFHANQHPDVHSACPKSLQKGSLQNKGLHRTKHAPVSACP